MNGLKKVQTYYQEMVKIVPKIVQLNPFFGIFISFNFYRNICNFFLFFSAISRVCHFYNIFSHFVFVSEMKKDIEK